MLDQSVADELKTVLLSNDAKARRIEDTSGNIKLLAVKTILPFSTAYLCGSGFSTLVQLKSKQRNRLNIDHDLRVTLSTVTPDFETLIKSKVHSKLSH